MRQRRRGFLAAGAAGLAALPLLTRQGLAQPAPTTHIFATITAVKSDAVEVTTTDGAAMTIGYGPGTRMLAVTGASLSDIKPGDFVGTAARPGADGKLVALEVHIFPDSLRGTGEGHRPFTMGPQTTMTNGTVGADIVSVGGISGRTITVTYAGGRQTVLVPKGVPVVTFAVGDDRLLKPGVHVSIVATEGADGKKFALRILVGQKGLMPPV